MSRARVLGGLQLSDDAAFCAPKLKDAEASERPQTGPKTPWASSKSAVALAPAEPPKLAVPEAAGRVD